MGPKMFFFFFAALAHVAFSMNCPGCPMEHDVNDPTMKQLLMKTVSRYTNQPMGTEDEQVLVLQVTKVTSQVVSGMLYKYDFEAEGVKTKQMYQCQMTLFDQPWEDRYAEVEEFSCKPVSNRNKRSTFVGGEVEIDLKATGELPKYEAIISSKMAQSVNTRNAFGIVQVLKATRQVVAGIKTRLEVEVAETDCIFGRVNSLEECSFYPKGHQVCQVAVVEKPWLNQVVVTEMTCKRKPDCLGCLSEVNTNDDKANQILQRTLTNLNAHSTKVWDLQKINNVQFGVASGFKYVFDFEAVDETKTLHRCDAQVLTQPWISPEPTVIDFKCTPLSQ